MADLCLQSLWHLLELLPSQAESSGGIALPERFHANQSTAIVLQSGPGLDLGYAALPPMAREGDLVLFDAASFHPLEGRCGFIRDTQLVGCLYYDGHTGEECILPLNDWCLIRDDDPPEVAGSLALPERYQRRQRSGVVLDVGPGRLYLGGEWRGQRRSVEEICGREVVGWRVWWHENAAALSVGRTRLLWTLVRAEDLLAVEDDESISSRNGIAA